MARSSNTQAPPDDESQDDGQTEALDDDDQAQRFDLGPWAETPSSSRVSRYRYDYLNREIQCQWRNNKNHGYYYEGISYAEFVAFARAVSKGKRINSHLNNKIYELMDTDRLNAPSNPRRTGLQSRVRG